MDSRVYLLLHRINLHVQPPPIWLPAAPLPRSCYQLASCSSNRVSKITASHTHLACPWHCTLTLEPSLGILPLRPLPLLLPLLPLLPLLLPLLQLLLLLLLCTRSTSGRPCHSQTAYRVALFEWHISTTSLTTSSSIIIKEGKVSKYSKSYTLTAATSHQALNQQMQLLPEQHDPPNFERCFRKTAGLSGGPFDVFAPHLRAIWLSKPISQLNPHLLSHTYHTSNTTQPAHMSAGSFLINGASRDGRLQQTRSNGDLSGSNSATPTAWNTQAAVAASADTTSQDCSHGFYQPTAATGTSQSIRSCLSLSLIHSLPTQLHI